MTENNISYFIRLKGDIQASGTTRAEKVASAQASWPNYVTEAKAILSQYPEITIVNDLWLAQSLVASSTKEDFEKLYRVTLTYESFTVNNLNKGPYQAGDWRVHGKPQIPKGLEGVIDGIWLNQKVFLTD